MRYARASRHFIGGISDMRALILLTAVLTAACASQPSDPQATSSGGAIAASDAQRLALSRNLNLKVIDKDGQQLFCRSNFQTASRIQRDTTCYTAAQLDKMQAQQTQELDQLSNRHPNKPGLGPGAP
jgi:hypothetical protein